MIKFDNLHFAYGDKTLFSGLQAHFQTPGFHAVIGPNGSGKSTLLKMAAKVLKPGRGAVLIGSNDVAKLSQKALAKKLAFLPQHTTPAACSVYEAVLLGRNPHLGFLPTRDDHAVTETILEKMGLSAFKQRSAASLSGGELQKVLIARALAQGAQAILLDEPINHLDIKSRLETLAALEAIALERSLTVVAVLHDLALALRYADRIICLEHGNIAYAGSADKLEPALIERVFGVRCELVSLRGKQHLIALHPVE